MSLEVTNTGRSDLVAKLMARENITIVYRKASTASFDLKTRTLYMPILEHMDEDSRDLFLGHEVGHALYTPLEGWHESVCPEGKYRGSRFKGYLNVIEDTRIERKIQSRYPGLRRSFVEGYNSLWENGFFKISVDVNDLAFIDRINVYFKAGAMCGVRFSAEEREWIDEIYDLESWEDVKDFTERLYAYCKEVESREKDSAPEESESADAEGDDADAEGDEGDDDDAEGDEAAAEADAEGDDAEGDDADGDDADAEGDDAEGDDTAAEGDGDDSEGAAAAAKGAGENGSDEELDAPAPITDEAMREAMEMLAEKGQEEGVPWRFELIHHGLDFHLIPHQEIIKDITEASPNYWDRIKDSYPKALGTLKPAINNMLKVFMMKKRGEEYANTRQAKTGVIDPTKVSNYMFTEDIFLRSDVVNEGKNHGIIFYLDWSGSMAADVSAMAQQTVAMTEFCRKADIPYRVYAFSCGDYLWGKLYRRHGLDRLLNGKKEYDNRDPDKSYIGASDHTGILELLCSDMKRSDYVKMCNLLLSYSEGDTAGLPLEYRLGVTPLEDAIIMSFDLFKKFQQETEVKKTVTMWFTDGDGFGAKKHFPEGVYASDFGSKIILQMGGREYVNPKLSAQYAHYAQEELLIRAYQDITGSPCVHFRLVGGANGWHEFIRAYRVCEFEAIGRTGRRYVPHAQWNAQKKIYGQMSNQSHSGYVEMANHPYVKFYAMHRNALTFDAKDEYEGAGENRRSLRAAFKRRTIRSSKMISFLKQVVEFIA